MGTVENPETANLRLTMKPSTKEAIQKIAVITGLPAGSEDKVVEEALRVYEWVIGHQSRGKRIRALDTESIEVLERAPTLSGRTEELRPMFKPSEQAAAEAYFNKSN